MASPTKSEQQSSNGQLPIDTTTWNSFRTETSNNEVLKLNHNAAVGDLLLKVLQNPVLVTVILNKNTSGAKSAKPVRSSS